MMVGKQKPATVPLMFLAQLNDAVVVAGLFVLLTSLQDGYHGIFMGMGIYIFGLTLMVFRGLGVYQSWRLAPAHHEIHRLLAASLTLFLIIVATSYLLEMNDRFPRHATLAWMALIPSLLSLERLVIRTWLRKHRVKGHNARTAVIVGVGEQARKLARLVEENLWAGTKILGYFDDPGHEPIEGYQLLGGIRDLPAYVRDHEVDIAFLALSMKEQQTFQWLLQELADTTVSISVIPDILFLDMLLGASITYFDTLPLITLRESPIIGMNAIVKRAEDLVLAGLILALVSPLMLLIALGIKLTSPGPVLFKQWRYGLNCNGIQVYKFRSMTVCEDGYEFSQASRQDPRVTPLGAFLRRTSLDELPQFINVLQGSMSIVGPRP
ncbi:MAG: exopolysaccharide biosynthesis polyprenyl glycosylphosphotransferase, partial [Syntrophales bacterium LBB04]|nr:exopolysaccharide biosynthesis polyprenyl glycosylphosphotransferase [Syntrophales bacterium LBB04]